MKINEALNLVKDNISLALGDRTENPIDKSVFAYCLARQAERLADAYCQNLPEEEMDKLLSSIAKEMATVSVLCVESEV
jgi:hypothetical protein